ncbi:hypothetical protein B0J11DRAFT_566412 [Dendryphion nanum]|uniref:F-box domain-containing protein n=1 Tax=Dendryphion nanum TaxID=256645 RepID=A0A9P9E5L5_9PLEO|nr:hypothetical protein B0J11DRAFT_566412 [Dendryphion nanum]
MAPTAPPRVSPRTAKNRDFTLLPGEPRVHKPKLQKKGIQKVLSASDASSISLRDFEAEKPFPFLKLPGELRNRVYDYCVSTPQQALLQLLPRRHSLRSCQSPEKISKQHRKFTGLTQVCRQLRWEFRPLYMLAQEIGLDFTKINEYLNTFYPPGTPENSRAGNITVAISGRVTPFERRPEGVDVCLMLDVWANSWRIEAGFGRYYCPTYEPAGDGEAKDLYRLFGRMVLPDRKCTTMNRDWRGVLRGRWLAAVRVHRAPKLQDRPFIHCLYKPEFKEHWMNAEVSDVEASKKDEDGADIPSWLVRMGFTNMEYYDVKVGVINRPSLEKLNAGELSESSSPKKRKVIPVGLVEM